MDEGDGSGVDDDHQGQGRVNQSLSENIATCDVGEVERTDRRRIDRVSLQQLIIIIITFY